MKTAKKTITIVLSLILLVGIVLCAVACDKDSVDNSAEVNTQIQDLEASLNSALAEKAALNADLEAAKAEKATIESKIDAMQAVLDELLAKSKADEKAVGDFSDEAYAKTQYIDKVLPDRDCVYGEDFKLSQKWISWTLMSAGYAEEEIDYQEFNFDYYIEKSELDTKKFVAANSFKVDEKSYKIIGYDPEWGPIYGEDENGDYAKVVITSENIVLEKKGKSDKQIIIGAHYDGTGTGDNGSSVALALTVAEQLKDVEQEYTIVFAFFSAEEYGLYGADEYAYGLTEKEIENTLYYINLDSLICGDYCYLYGGVQDDEKKVVTETEAFDNAMAVAAELGLTFKNNPWTYENPAPGYNTPEYASPSTGDWSDHVGFADVGIKYVYFEATNWEIPGPWEDYSGYGETYLVDMIMNTENDYLDYIEKYFPGRPQAHLSKFSQLLWALVNQDDVNF